jgi:hypothetical protein
MPLFRTFLAANALLWSTCAAPVMVHASNPPGWFIADCGPGPWTGSCAGDAAEEGWQPVSGNNGNIGNNGNNGNNGGSADLQEFLADCGVPNPENWCAEEAADYGNNDSGGGSGGSSGGGSIHHDQSATSEVELDSYLNAELTGGSDGFSSLTMAMNASGAMEDVVFDRTFRVASNTDHEIQIWYDAIKVDGVCVPVFDSEGSGSIAGEADVLGGEIKLSVGDSDLFNATAASTLDNALQDTNNGVSVECDDATPTTVGKALVTVTNNVASTFSREYTLTATAFGEGGSIIFADGAAINAGDAPAGQYDNDILIATGILYNHSYDDTNDKYAGASFSNNGAKYYDND